MALTDSCDICVAIHGAGINRIVQQVTVRDRPW
jgi:hypothetical protein